MRTDFTISPTYLAGVIESASDEELTLGREWYHRERGWVDATAHVYECRPEQVAAITAVLSAQSAWDETGVIHPNQHTNKLTALNVLTILADQPEALGEAKLYATGRQRAKCRAIYEDRSFTLTPALGPKCFPFACNLTGDLDQLTLDQFAWAAVIGWQGVMTKLPAITPKRRLASELAYLWLAEQLKVKLAEAQAMVWVPYRRLRKEAR